MPPAHTLSAAGLRGWWTPSAYSSVQHRGASSGWCEAFVPPFHWFLVPVLEGAASTGPTLSVRRVPDAGRRRTPQDWSLYAATAVGIWPLPTLRYSHSNMGSSRFPSMDRARVPAVVRGTGYREDASSRKAALIPHARNNYAYHGALAERPGAEAPAQHSSSSLSSSSRSAVRDVESKSPQKRRYV